MSSVEKRFGREFGFTLIELLVSMAIGLVVTGAIYAAYLSSYSMTKVNRAMTQIAEDATIGFNVLRPHLSEATYSQPIGTGGTTFTHPVGALPTTWIRGCNTNFADLSLSIDLLTCGATGGNSIAVAYDADLNNSIKVKDATNTDVPSDCVGNALSKGPTPGPPAYFLSYSRFYVANGALTCRGPGSATAQPLVENISSMQITYGIAAASGKNVVAYKDATQVQALGAWSRVISVRVCLVVQSADEVLDDPEFAKYQGCDPFGDATTPGDRRIRRAFTSTFVLHNRIS